jgi:RNA polymerase subunit RPABC4/transcription elongation factor Spt4
MKSIKNKPKACKSCRRILTPDAKFCPYCGSDDLTKFWSGIVKAIDPEKSIICKKLNIKSEGDYALKF